MSQPLRHFPCPACGAPMRIQGSHQQHDAMREQYAACQNPHCGATYLIRSEVVRQISPASGLFQPQITAIPVCDAVQDRALDLAREFVARPWQPGYSRDERLAACRDYLQELVKIDTHRAELTAARAIAEHESVGLVKEGWGLSIDDSSTACAIIDGGQQHAVSLRELVEFVRARTAREQQSALL